MGVKEEIILFGYENIFQLWSEKGLLGVFVCACENSKEYDLYSELGF